jgi:hypothetical protein
MRAASPTTPIFLVAHSHGGNVGAYALKLLEAGAVQGMVTIASPFIRVRRRTLSEGGKNILRVFGFFAALACFFAGLAVAMSISDHFPMGLDVLFLLFALSTVTTLIDLGLSATVSSGPRLLDYQSSLADQLAIDFDSDIPVLSVSVARDEPRAWLTILVWIAELPASVLGLVAGTATFRWALGATACLAGAMIAAQIGAEGAGIPLMIICVSLLAIWILAPILHLVMILASPLLRSNPLGFGWEAVLQNWLIAVDTSVVAPVSWRRAERATFSASRLRGALPWPLSLYHSRLYDDEHVVSTIATWLTERADSREWGPPSQLSKNSSKSINR